MTRDEALKALCSVPHHFNQARTHREASEEFLRKLEVLGLLKFDEEPAKGPTWRRRPLDVIASAIGYADARNVLDRLALAGYEVVERTSKPLMVECSLCVDGWKAAADPRDASFFFSKSRRLCTCEACRAKA